MNRQERANWVLKRLEELYPAPEIPLEHQDPFTLLVSVVLSAQCTDKMVNRVTPNLWKLAKTPEKMRTCTVEQIRTIIQPCGLAPQKAKAIRELSAILVDQFEGQVPEDLDQLQTLPGVGRKTASVVMCQAFGKAAFPVDTHIHRLAQRWKLTDGRSVEQTERDLRKLFPEQHWAKLHLQIIYYGREHCSARGCDGTVCPICRELFPKRRRPIETRK